MNRDFGRICKIARKNAGLSQEHASELLGVSVRTLINYEAGSTTVPDDIVAEMIRIYHTQIIGYFYLTMTSEVGCMILPPIKLTGISSGALKLRVSLNHAVRLQTQLDEICCDDKIEPHEERRFQRWSEVINDVISSALSLKLSPLKIKKAASAVTDTASITVK